MSASKPAPSDAPIFEVRGLVKHYPIGGGLQLRRNAGFIQAVDGVDFSIHKGETLGLVGESGCGKTTVARTLMRLEEPSAGEALFHGGLYSTRVRRRRTPYESLAQHLEHIMTLFVQGLEVGADDAEGLRAVHGAKAPRDLLYLGHADGALGKIVDKGYAQIRHETQYRIGMLAHAVDEVDEVEGHGLRDPAPALVLPLGARIADERLVQDRAVVPENALYAPCAQCRFVLLPRRLAVVASADQQVDHAFGPALAGGFTLKSQFAQQVCIAQSMHAVLYGLASTRDVCRSP